ncbi:hypothetical protein JY452_17355, partial [Stenotrophomonas maltophilia]|nr:hypothetical protein [Stenotrophomonas maltophilia]
ERTAASGWAGLGVYGVSCPPTPPRHPSASLLLLLLLLRLWAGAGRSPAETLPNHDCSHLPGGAALAKVEELT